MEPARAGNLAIDEQCCERGRIASEVRRQPHSQVEATLADPHLGDLLASESNLDRLDHVTRGEANAGGCFAIDLYRQLEAGWTKIRTIALAGDGPVSIAWIQ